MLEFMLKRAPVKERGQWLAQIREKGLLKKVPLREEEKEDEPDLLVQSLWIWEAFTALTVQRYYAQHGPQPIALSDIEAWASLHDVNKYDKPFLSNCLLKMDRIFMEHTYAQLKREREKNEKKHKSAPMRRGR